MSRELKGDLLLYLPARAVPALIGLAAAPILTRLVPAPVYGDYLVMTAALAVLTSVSVSWITSSAIRFFPTAQDEGGLDRLRRAVLLLTALSTAAGAAVLGLLALSEVPGTGPLGAYLLPAAAAFLAGAWFEAMLGPLRAARRPGWFSLFTIWQSAAALGLGAAFTLSKGAGADRLLWGTAVAGALALPPLAAVSFAGLRRSSSERGLFPDRETWKDLLAYGLPAAGINFATVAASLSDRFVLSALTDASSVAVYGAVYTLSEKSLFFLNSMFLLASTPIACRIWEKDGAGPARDFTAALTRTHLLAAAPVAAAMCALAGPVVRVFFPPAYHSGAAIVPYVALGALLVGIAQRHTLGLVFHKKTGRLALCYGLSAAVNLTLNLLTVTRYGFMAAAVNTLVAYAVLLAASYAASRDLFAWPFPWRSTLRIALAAAATWAVMSGVSAVLSAADWVKIALAGAAGAAVYGGSVAALGEWDPRRSLSSLLGAP